MDKKNTQQPPLPADGLSDEDARLVLFRGQKIRRVFHKNEWFYSIVDVIAAIIQNDRAARYWADLKIQLLDKEGFFAQPSEKIGQLKMTAADGKLRFTESADVETLFRIIQSIPHKNAEPFKRWLAKVGYERIQEIQNPDIGVKRAVAQYRADGRGDEWIRGRIKSTLTRKELTEEWEKRGVEGKQYGALTDTVSKGALGVTTGQHKRVKNLRQHHNLRDNMSTLELAIMNLGEAATGEFTRARDAQGFAQNKNAAKDGGNVAGRARKDIETKTGKRIVTAQNFAAKKPTPALPQKKQ